MTSEFQRGSALSIQQAYRQPLGHPKEYQFLVRTLLTRAIRIVALIVVEILWVICDVSETHNSLKV